MTDSSDFFVAGGTLRPNALSYVTRPADRELLERILAGEFCYVLTSRQMGKSSLMIRTAQRLKQQGCAVAMADLTSIGSVSADEWYQGLLTRIKQGLRLAVDVPAWWAKHANLGAPQRFREFLHDIALAQVSDPIAIFIDEIDSTLNLQFRDDFFAAIRAMYNARASDPAYDRLTFVLLGVATPTDLIQDRERTPFNIGRKIDLYEFSQADAESLRDGLEASHAGQGDLILARIFYWTSGHPYLTQKLCLAITQSAPQEWVDSGVDGLVERYFFSEEGRKDANLMFVRDRIQTTPAPERRRMLKLYGRVYRAQTVPDDDRSRTQNYLELFGLVRVEQGQLRVRNAIYRHIFDQAWIEANTPLNAPRIIAIVASAIAVLLIALAAYFVLRSQKPPEVQAQLYRESFQRDPTPDVRIEALAGLFDEVQGYDQEALELFYSLTPSEQQNLFLNVKNQVLAPKVVSVVRRVYVTLDSMPNGEDRAVMKAMIDALYTSQQPDADVIIEELTYWEAGREAMERGENDQAINSYTLALNLNNDHPVIYYDRAIAYIEKGQYGDALEDLNNMIRIAKTAPPTPTPVPASPTVDATTTPEAGQSPTTGNSPSGTTDPSTTPTVTATLPTTITNSLHSSRFINSDSIIETVRTTIRDNPELLNYFAENAGKYQQWGDLTSEILALKHTQTTTSVVVVLGQTIIPFTDQAGTALVGANQARTAIAIANQASTTLAGVNQARTTLAGFNQASTTLAGINQARTTLAGSVAFQPPVPTPVPTRRPAPTPVPPPPLFMAVQKTGEGSDLRCINVRVFLPSGYPVTTSGWRLVADGLGASAPFNSGGYAGVCVPNEKQEFTFTILPAGGVRILSGNRGIPARGGDIFEAPTQQ